MAGKLSYAELELRLKVLEQEVASSQQKDIELLENRNFLASIVASIQDGISVLDRDLNILQVNHAMEKWYAHAMPLVGKKCYTAYHERQSPCEVCPVRQTFATEQAAYEVVPKRGPGGRITGWLDLYSFPLVDSTTCQFRGVIEYVRDITERKLAEEALKIAHNELERRVAERTADLALANHQMLQEIAERKATENALRRSEAELAKQKAALLETNTALKVVLKKMKHDKREIEERVLINIQELIEPSLEKLRIALKDSQQKALLDVLHSHIQDIVSPFLHSLSLNNLRLTPGESRVANLVRQGKTTKEIAALLCLSAETINVYRKKIRKKCGLSNSRANLHSALSSYSSDK